MRARTRSLTWILFGRALASVVQVVTCHSWRRSASSGFGRTAVSVSSGHRQSRTLTSFTLAVANLFPRRNRHLRSQCRCRSTGSARRRSFTLLLLLAFPLLLLLLPPSPSGTRIRLLSSRLDAPTMAFFPLLLPQRLHSLMMAFFPILPSTPVSLPLILSGARDLPPRTWVCLRRLLLHPFLVRHPRPLGRIPFPFLPYPLHIFLHPLPSASCSRVSSFSSSSPPPPARASRVTSLSSVSQSSSRTVFYTVCFLN